MSLKEEDDRISTAVPVGSSSERLPQHEGVFSRPNFAKTVTSLIGNNVKVKTKSGSTYEGIFTTFSSNFEVIIDLSHDVDPKDPFYKKVKDETIIFNSDDIVSISCVNVNLKDALDLSQRLEISGDYSSKRDPQWDSNHCSADPDLTTYVDKGWNINQQSEYDDEIEGYSFYCRSADFVKEPNIPQKREDCMKGSAESQNPNYVDSRGNYPKPQRKPKYSDGSPLVTGFPSNEVGKISEKLSNLNPYAKPFTPMDAAHDKESSQNPSMPSLAAMVLPAYVVSSNSAPTEVARYGKSEGQGITGAPPSLLGPGSLQNQYMPYAPYGDGYDEKLYSPYDSLPLSAHEYQQYYPHLQYIQYFRRFY